MSHRRCGTCRYFEEGGLAGSGWCRHPQRRDLQHMVLVRRSELACRTGWDQDLWEPKGEEHDLPLLTAISSQDTLAVERPAVQPPRVGEPAGAGRGSLPPVNVPGQDTGSGPREAARMVPARPSTGARAARLQPVVGTQEAERRPLNPLVPGARDSATGARTAAAGSPDAPFAPWPLADPKRDARDPRATEPTGSAGADETEPPWLARHGWQQSGATEPFHLPEVSAPEDLAEVEDGYDADEASPVAAISLRVDGLPSLPQCCRTCRDFRPIGDGSQGWCGNPYAFPERTRVMADDLACYSSLGSWWLPTDDWWLQQADISHHGMPTPHVDEYLRQLRAERERARRRVGS